MSAAELLGLLLETTLASSMAIVAVLSLRRRLRQAFGSGVAYATWLLVPAMLVAVLLPAREVALDVLPALTMTSATHVALAPAGTMPFDLMAGLAVAWACGAVLMGLRMLIQQHAFARMLGPLRRRADGCWQAGTVAGLPAALGLLRPKVVVPADFDSRYSTDQRVLMHEHERIHIRRGDLHLNAVVALLRCLFWFNPLVHVAAGHFRHDQELACDRRVIARHLHHRRAYGEAMLHTQLASQPLPLGCHWGFSHPLRERIEMLKQNPKTRSRIAAGTALVAALAVATGAAAWAAQPERATTATSTSVAARGEHVLGLSVRIDDSAPMTSSGRVTPGRETVHDFDHAGQHWKVALTVDPRDDGTYAITTRILRDGKVQATPSLIVKAGEDAGITVGERTDDRLVKGLELGLVVQRAEALALTPDGRIQNPPRYPKSAAENRISGRVTLLIDIDAQGKPTHVAVEKAEPAGVFDSAAVEAAYKWQLSPEVRNGQPVPSRVRVPVDFKADAMPSADGGA